MSWTPLRDSSLLRTQAFVSGQWCDSLDGSIIDVFNPANRERIATVPCLGEVETERAIAAGLDAFQTWSRWTSHERGQVLSRFFELVLENADDLAYILTSEQGKPLKESLGEIKYAASFLQWFAEQGKRVQGEILSSPIADKRMMVLRQPIGVCAAITPWNFPAAMITRKVAPALAAGCTMIVKPSELTPLTALALAELARRAGVPAGVLQVLTGEPAKIGRVLTQSTTVRKLSFTGSTQVGRMLASQCASSIKRLSLELGGHAPFIVMDDADIDLAVAGAIVSKYRNSGQTCICTNRFYVHEKVSQAFVERLVEASKALRVGFGTDGKTDLGPLINSQAVDKVQRHVEDAVQHGARLLCGGKPHALGGTFFEPTVLSGVTTDMLIAQEETFGPVSAIMEFKNEQQVIELANATEYGLAAYIFSRDVSTVWRIAEALEYGMVGVNTGSISTEVAPFGGVKQSGLGREGSHLGIDEYLNVKYVCLAI